MKSDGTYPLKIRVTVNRKHKETALGIYLLKEDWDSERSRVKPTHVNAKLIALKISQTLTKVQEKTLTVEVVDRVATAAEISNVVHNANSGSPTFHEFCQSEVSELHRVGKSGNADTYRTAANRLVKFGGKSIRFESIDFDFLTKFHNSLAEEGVSVNGIAAYMRAIRAIYNKAIKRRIVDKKYYPFDTFQIKTTKTASRSLPVSVIRKLKDLDLPRGSRLCQARDFFMLSFYLIGINFIDLLKVKQSSIQQGRVVFNRSKTHKLYSILLPEEAIAIFSRYSNSGIFLLPVLHESYTDRTVKNKAKHKLAIINKALKTLAAEVKYEGEITTYHARYSWANIAKSLGYSKDLIAEALGHSYGNAVTSIYLDAYDSELIDNANATVIATLMK